MPIRCIMVHRSFQSDRISQCRIDRCAKLLTGGYHSYIHVAACLSLVVMDDHAMVRQGLRAILESYGQDLNSVVKWA